MDDNTIGAVDWPRLHVGTDGERITVLIPAFFQSNHVPFLDGILSSRLGDIVGPDVLLELRYGDLSRTETEHEIETRYDEGYIVLTGISEPWPDGAALRGMLEAAFEEAGALEVEQKGRVNALFEHLRRTGGD